MPGSRAALITLAACGMVWGYLAVLLANTELGRYSVSIGNPVILAMFGACAITLGLAARCVIDRRIPRRISFALAIAALVPAITLAWLHRSQAVCDFHTEIGTNCVSLF